MNMRPLILGSATLVCAISPLSATAYPSASDLFDFARTAAGPSTLSRVTSIHITAAIGQMTTGSTIHSQIWLAPPHRLLERQQLSATGHTSARGNQTITMGIDHGLVITTSTHLEAVRRAKLRELIRLSIGVLLTDPSELGLTTGTVSEGMVDGEACYRVPIQGDDLQATVLFSATTHHLVMLEETVANHNMMQTRFSDFHQTESLVLPSVFSVHYGTAFTERWSIVKVDVNPSDLEKQFEQHISLQR